MSIAIKRTIGQHADVLSQYLPEGPLFAQAKRNGSNMRKFIVGLCKEFLRVNESVDKFKNEINPYRTIEFIELWEKEVGIPDDCFPIAGTVDERRTNVLIKLGSLGVQTVSDFENLAALFGVTVTITPGIESVLFPVTLPILLLPPEEARFVIQVNFVTVQTQFPMIFPFSFGEKVVGILQCLFTELKPANCEIIFTEST